LSWLTIDNLGPLNAQNVRKPSNLTSLSAFAPVYISETALKAGLSQRDLGSVLQAIFSRNTTALETIPNIASSVFGDILLAADDSFCKDPFSV
jgi:hypothetical protein